MPAPLVTLTTDFGEDSPYVAAVKGVLLGVNPDVRLVDLSHQIPPQDIPHASFFLTAALPYFPPNTLHVIVVDPGVGTGRALLYAEVAGQRLLVPDNGCWTRLIPAGETPLVIRLAEPRFWRQPVSHTFHGRDILAPVAGHLSLGIDPRALGPVVTEWVRWDEPAPRITAEQLAGEVVYVDHFGNLITNIPGKAFLAFADRPVHTYVGDQRVTRRVRTYAEAKVGTPVVLVSSTDRLEIAVTQGNAAQRLQARTGTPVVAVVVE